MLLVFHSQEHGYGQQSARPGVGNGIGVRYLKRHAVSGLNVREFCRREQLAETSFFAWRRTIRQRDGEVKSSDRPAFVPAVVTDTPPCDTSIVLELGSGRALKLPESISAAAIGWRSW